MAFCISNVWITFERWNVFPVRIWQTLKSSVLLGNNCSLVCFLPGSDAQVAAKGFFFWSDHRVRLLLTFSSCDFAECHSEHYRNQKSVMRKPPYLLHRFNGSFTSAPQGKNRAWKHHKMRQSTECNYLSSVETRDQVAVILSLISSKTTVMQFGVADDPWAGGTDLTASNSSHLSRSSANNLKTEVFHTPAALATGIVTVQFLKMVTAPFCKLLPLWWDEHSSLGIYFWLAIQFPMQQRVVKGMRPFYPEKSLQAMFLFHSKKLFKDIFFISFVSAPFCQAL